MDTLQHLAQGFGVALLPVNLMVAALGAAFVARGREPSELDLPADSSMPVTAVQA